MAEEEKPEKPEKRWKHWKFFVPASIAYAKLGKRAEQGLCIGCGHAPCQCKNPDRRTKPTT